MASAWNRCARCWPAPTPTRPRAISPTAAGCGKWAPTTRFLRPSTTSRLLIAYHNGAAVRVSRRGRRGGLGGRYAQRRLCQRQAVRAGGHFPPAGRQHHRDGGPHSRRPCRSCRPPSRRPSICAVAMDQTADHPRFGARRGAHPAHLGAAGDPGGVRLPAQTCAAPSFPAWRCRYR